MKVSNNEFGDINNYTISGLTSFIGYLYAATGRWNLSGIEVWRCQLCNSQADWVKVVSNGFGNPDNVGQSNLEVMDGMLYVVIGNENTGLEVWRTGTGNPGEWSQVSNAGFGDSTNAYPGFGVSVTTFHGSLFLGVGNSALGSEIWQSLDDWIYLPVVIR